MRDASYPLDHTCLLFWLVVSNIWIIFHFIYGTSSFPLTFRFFKMVKTTNQFFLFFSPFFSCFFSFFPFFAFLFHLLHGFPSFFFRVLAMVLPSPNDAVTRGQVIVSKSDGEDLELQVPMGDDEYHGLLWCIYIYMYIYIYVYVYIYICMYIIYICIYLCILYIYISIYNIVI